MNKNDIICLAVEAGWDAQDAEFDMRIQAFASLIADFEKEKCIQKLEQESNRREIESLKAEKINKYKLNNEAIGFFWAAKFLIMGEKLDIRRRNETLG